MTTPSHGLLFHFTHIDNLASVAANGLWADNVLAGSNYSAVEVGNQEIKGRRRNQVVPIPPHGSVADYVPFYFAARSPMLYAIHKGNVPTFNGIQNDVVYLVSSTSTLSEVPLPFVYTDRNAALAFARYSNDLSQIDSMIDWTLMEGTWFNNTDSEPDRLERRMAEFLVRGPVPWTAFLGVATIDDAMAQQATSVLASVGVTASRVEARPGWYFS